MDRRVFLRSVAADAKFHYGAPVTSKDVKWRFDRAVTVGGFPTFQTNTCSLREPEQVVIVDDYTNFGAVAARRFARHPLRGRIQMAFQDPIDSAACYFA